MKIDYLAKALTSLDKALQRFSTDSSDLEIRDACIQRFEYTYELSIKLLKRFLEFEMPIAEKVDQLNYRDLIRVACEVGLLRNPEKWFVYREARNQTSHVYDEIQAAAVFAIIPDFFQESSKFYQALVTRLQ
jgi:nucleotidyltransferase substrate binding protein (TIGR01987 family)